MIIRKIVHGVADFTFPHNNAMVSKPRKLRYYSSTTESVA